jgi:hypothetical protein
MKIKSVIGESLFAIYKIHPKAHCLSLSQDQMLEVLETDDVRAWLRSLN